MHLLLLVLLAAAPRPTPAALQKAFGNNEAHVVTVKGPKHSGPGVVVSSDGHIVTSVDYVAIDSAKVIVGPSRDEISAATVFADSKLKVAVLRANAGEYGATAVDFSRALSPNDWVVAISKDKTGKPEPKLGQVLRAATEKTPFIETDIFLPAGTPLFDPKGKLVAVLVTSKGRAVPLPLVKERLEATKKLTKLTAEGSPP